MYSIEVEDAGVAKLVDVSDLGSDEKNHESSSLSSRNLKSKSNFD